MQPPQGSVNTQSHLTQCMFTLASLPQMLYYFDIKNMIYFYLYDLDTPYSIPLLQLLVCKYKKLKLGYAFSLIYLNFAGIYNIKVVALVALINDDLPGYGTDWKHSIKDI